MTIVDFHPDDLLEREIAGTLSAADERRLAAHVAQCSSCQLERQLRADFDHELGNPTAPILLPTLVSGALRAARAPDVSDPHETEGPGLRARRSRRRIAVLIASGVALSAGLAAARPDLAGRALEFISRGAKDLLSDSSAPRADTPASAGRAPESPSAPAAAVAAAPAAAVAAAPDGKAVSRSAELESELPPASQRRVEAKVMTREAAPARAPESAHGEPSIVQPSIVQPSIVQPSIVRAEEKLAPSDASDASAGSLFDRANDARRRGLSAATLYAELQARFPESAEARLSFAIVGRMQLDAGDAERAIVNFEAYLSTGEKALREQTLAGRALAWGRLGNHERERQSWRALLGAYPGSAYAALAQRRLGQERR